MTRLLRTEATLLRRDPTTSLLGVLAPVVILIGISFMPEARDVSDDLGGLSAVDVFVPTLSVFAIASMALIVMPGYLASYRELGILRRLRTTPLSPSALVVSQIALNAVVALTAVVAVTVVGNLALGVALPGSAAGWVAAVALATASLLAVGMLVAALAPTAKLAGAIGPLLWFPFMFLGGLWIPREEMGATLVQISDLTPVGAAVGAIGQASSGSFPDAGLLAVMAVWAVGATIVAAVNFRWE
ncbi:ABC transporter permease [Thermoleophilia bacterium SCSIO 60948]|nr:ABC transporter permease [Thermoleophilia bacterium SCSIO 60948]